jgi:hypothetical protein
VLGVWGARCVGPPPPPPTTHTHNHTHTHTTHHTPTSQTHTHTTTITKTKKKKKKTLHREPASLACRRSPPAAPCWHCAPPPWPEPTPSGRPAGQPWADAGRLWDSRGQLQGGCGTAVGQLLAAGGQLRGGRAAGVVRNTRSTPATHPHHPSPPAHSLPTPPRSHQPPTLSRAISLATPANSSASRNAALCCTVASTSYSSALTDACASQERSKCCGAGRLARGRGVRGWKGGCRVLGASGAFEHWKWGGRKATPHRRRRGNPGSSCPAKQQRFIIQHTTAAHYTATPIQPLPPSEAHLAEGRGRQQPRALAVEHGGLLGQARHHPRRLLVGDRLLQHALLNRGGRVFAGMLEHVCVCLGGGAGITGGGARKATPREADARQQASAPPSIYFP